jgi:hypothetical protein
MDPIPPLLPLDPPGLAAVVVLDPPAITAVLTPGSRAAPSVLLNLPETPALAGSSVAPLEPGVPVA